jgi:hypothetical protein
MLAALISSTLHSTLHATCDAVAQCIYSHTENISRSAVTEVNCLANETNITDIGELVKYFIRKRVKWGYLFSVTSDVSLKASVQSIIRLRRVAGACECGNETLASIKCGGIP